jgi:hypothetical protein
MPSHQFFREVIELATCDSIHTLVKGAVSTLEHELKRPVYIEFWSENGDRFVAGDYECSTGAYGAWIGVRHTMGAIRLQSPPPCQDDIELLARQLAPLAELLIDYDARQRLTIREDVDRLYERRILDALVRSDWNASEVARRLNVSRSRVARVTRRWRRR